MNDLYPTPLAAAQMYAVMGWRVAPVQPGSKVPSISEWQKRATTDADTISGWFNPPASQGAHPDVGVCIVTGRETGLWVLDVDVSDGKQGMETLRSLIADHGGEGLGETIVARTPSGGYHYYFAYPDDVEIHNSASNRLGAGLDVRGEGGQVNAAPTKRGDAAYRWADGRAPWSAEVQPAPAWLVELVKDEAKPQRPGTYTTGSWEGTEPVVTRELPPHSPTAVLAIRSQQDLLDGVPTFVTDYNARTNWPELLTSAGWEPCQTHGDIDYWARLGKSCREGISASTNYAGSDLLYVWSTSVGGLPSDRAYDRYGYMVHRDFGGDFDAAARHFVAERRQSESVAELIPKGDLLAPTPDEPEPTADPEKRHGRITWASDIEPQVTVWTWKHRIPAGELTLLAGREGLGKTTIAYTLAAYLTTGTLYGDFNGQPRSALIVATEDSWAKTIRPRLEAAGADLTRVARLDVVDRGIETEIDLPVDVEILDEALTMGDFGLLILDPLMSRLAANLDTHRDGDVRKALEPLVAWSHRTGVAVLGLIHVNKGGSGDPLTAVMGSRAFTAVARAVLTVMRSPGDGPERLLGLGKSNLGPTDPELVPTFSYRIESVSSEGDITTGRLVWGEEHKRDIADIWAEETETKAESTSKIDEASMWLEDFLTEHRDGFASQLVKEAGKKAGHSESTLKRAASRLKLRISMEGYPRTSVWRLSDQNPWGQNRGPTEPTEPTVSPTEQTVFPDQSQSV